MYVDPEARAETAPMPLPTASPPLVIIAEDQAEMRRLMILELEAERYTVDPVASGTALWRRCIDGPPADLIVTDVRMPGVDGIEVLRRLRRRGIDTPALVVTAFGDRRLHAEARALGARVLDKPFDFDDLLALIATLLDPWEAS